jgi:small subunit ribosomal protein S16
MLKLRMARAGAKNRPFYQIVVADSRNPRDGKFLEKLGTYNPLLPKDHKDRVTLNGERIKYWMSKGAQASDRVAIFIGKAGIAPMPARKSNPEKAVPGAKMTERAKEKAAKIAAAEETKNAPKEEAAPVAEAAAPEAEAPAAEAPAAEAETQA